MIKTNAKKCFNCKSNLPVTHFKSHDTSKRLSASCHICTQMKQYRRENTRWCNTCKMAQGNATNGRRKNWNTITNT